MAMPPTPAEPVEKKPSLLRRTSGMMLKLVAALVVAALLLGAGFGAGWYYFARPDSPVLEALKALNAANSTATEAETEDPAATKEEEPQKVPRPVPETEQFVTSYYSFKEALTSNLEGSRRFLQVTVALSTQYDATVMTNVDKNEIALRSDMLAVISTFTEDALKASNGRDALAAALRDAVNARLEALEGFGGVDAVWFPSFVMQ